MEALLCLEECGQARPGQVWSCYLILGDCIYSDFRCGFLRGRIGIGSSSLYNIGLVYFFQVYYWGGSRSLDLDLLHLLTVFLCSFTGCSRDILDYNAVRLVLLRMTVYPGL